MVPRNVCPKVELLMRSKLHISIAVNRATFISLKNAFKNIFKIMHILYRSPERMCLGIASCS